MVEGDQAEKSSSNVVNKGGGGRSGRGRGAGGRSGKRGRGGKGRSARASRSTTKGTAAAQSSGSTENGGSNHSSSKENDTPTTTTRAPRGGGGRGNRGGRGRSKGGRGGRGRGKNSSRKDKNKEDTNGNQVDNTKQEEEQNTIENLNQQDNDTTGLTTRSLALPALPPHFKPTKPGIPMLLTRDNSPEKTKPPPPQSRFAAAASMLQDQDETVVVEAPAPAPEPVPSTLATDTASPPVEAKPKKKKKKKPKKAKTPPPAPPQEPEPEKTATEALQALPAQQVSITAEAVVTVRKSDSTGSLQDSVTAAASVNTSSKKTKVKLSKRGKKSKGLSTDERANRKAALQFNRQVRACVEQSNPDAMRELLHNKRNHKFALDAMVLETVLRAYVMAAMFDDALYCLRNCTLPSTLSTGQTERILLCLPQNLRNSSAYTAADMINALCIATDFDVQTKRTYFLRIVRAIALEFLEESLSARDRICSAPCERLVRAAICVVDARLKRGKKPTDLVVNPGNQLGVFVPDTMENRGIQAGDAVSILPYAGPYPMSAESLDRNMIEATVTNINPMVLRLQDKTNANLYAMLTENVEGNVYRIDKLANRMGFQRQLAAAVAIASPLESRNKRSRPSRHLIQAITAMDENIDLVLRGSGSFQQSTRNAHGELVLTSTAGLCSKPLAWSATNNYDADQEETDDDEAVDADGVRDASRLALEKYGALQGLNASQCMAVEGASTNRLTLVQGPPGTGKTAVAIRILQHWVRLAASETPKDVQPNPILATSDSNIAVDNLVEGCANAGLRVVRLGRPEAIRPELLRFCIDRPTNSNNNRDSRDSYYGGNNSVAAFKEKIKAIRNAQVVCCTCIGSGGDILDNMVFERILVDEATQATEPAVLVPLTRGCRQLVLVGDHCQLPPTVLSTHAEEEGLGVPLFSRMVACGVPPFMLDTQYRMHPAIAMFPSDLFYGGKLKNGVSPPERRPLAGFPWPREEFPVAFVPVNHGVEMDDGVSKLNEAEAAAACDAVAALLAGGHCGVSDIAVVTPYAAQARLIRRMTRKLTQSQGPPYVEVSSTDGFQGREKEAVVFSAVRSNDYGVVGFVSDWRRVNVSFTRARRALIVIGNEQTLRRGDPDTWMPWLAWADAHGLNMDKPGIPRGRYEPEQLHRVRGGTTAAEMLKDVLERQQAQLKRAEKQLEKAERNAAGHIIGKEEEEEKRSTTPTPLTLEQDLALLENHDGNWDDSDDDDDFDISAHSKSQPSLTPVSSYNDFGIKADDSDEAPATDAWDL